MIVTCEECTTSFQLDESRLPAAGAQVRCSKCKHAFFLAHPSASQSEANHAIAEEATHDPLSSVPPVSSDPEADEEDWQFSKEVRIEGDEGRDPGDSQGGDEGCADELDADALLADVSAEDIESQVAANADAEAETDASPEPGGSGLELDSPPASAGPSRDESAFGSVDDFSSLMEDEDVAPVDLGGDAESGLGTEPAAAAESGFYASGGSTDDLGDPESWDLVGSDSPPAGRSTMSALGGGTGRDLPGLDLGFGGDSDDSLYADESRGPSWLFRGLAHIAGAAGWIVTLALIAGVSFVGFRSEWNRSIQSPQTATLGTLEAETSDIRWVETSRAGFVMTVEGQMRNTGPIELRPGVVQLSILDAAGQTLPAVPIVAGEPLPERSLRESSRERLLALAGSAAQRLRSVPLAPGEVRPFVAIALEDALPASARRLRLEITEAPTTHAALPLARPVDPIVDPLTGIESDSEVEGAETADSAIASDVGSADAEGRLEEGLGSDASATGADQVEEESGLSP